MSEAQRKRPPGMTLYREDIAALSVLPDADFKSAVIALFKISQGADHDPLSVCAEMAVKMIGTKVEEAALKYAKKCETYSRNRRGVNNCQQSSTMVDDGQALSPTITKTPTKTKTPTITQTPTINMCIGDEKSKRLKRFSPPTADQVREYAMEKGYGIDAQRFVDFYASKGWRVGNSPMKDWQAAVRNWASRNGGNANGNDNGGLGTGSAKHSAIVLPFECEY